MIEIANKRITHVQQLGSTFTADDGLGICDGGEYYVHDCVIDMSNVDDVDEACSVTWGSSATFKRCIIRGAGKLFLCGSGDASKADVERGRKVVLKDCIIEDFGRRGPEVQAGMTVEMFNCLIRNWGDPNYFDTRGFGAWAHADGKITAHECIFWQDSFWRPLGQFIRDIGNHIGQAVNDGGLLALLKPTTYLPGVCRGLMASDGGEVRANMCFKNRWWIRLEGKEGWMDEDEAELLMLKLEEMRQEVEEKVGVKTGVKRV